MSITNQLNFFWGGGGMFILHNKKRSAAVHTPLSMCLIMIDYGLHNYDTIGFRVHSLHTQPLWQSSHSHFDWRDMFAVRHIFLLQSQNQENRVHWINQAPVLGWRRKPTWLLASNKHTSMQQPREKNNNPTVKYTSVLFVEWSSNKEVIRTIMCMLNAGVRLCSRTCQTGERMMLALQMTSVQSGIVSPTWSPKILKTNWDPPNLESRQNNGTRLPQHHALAKVRPMQLKSLFRLMLSLKMLCT